MRDPGWLGPIALAAALLTGCGSVAPEGVGLSVMLDRAVVSRPPGADAAVGMSFRNVGRDPVFFRGCFGSFSAVVEETQGDGWRDTFAFGTPCPANRLVTTLRLDPGQSQRAVFGFGRDGQFRLRVRFGRRADEPFGFEVRTNPFTVQ